MVWCGTAHLLQAATIQPNDGTQPIAPSPVFSSSVLSPSMFFCALFFYILLFCALFFCILFFYVLLFCALICNTFFECNTIHCNIMSMPTWSQSRPTRPSIAIGWANALTPPIAQSHQLISSLSKPLRNDLQEIKESFTKGTYKLGTKLPHIFSTKYV